MTAPSPTPRMTKQRVAVLEALESSEEFRSAQSWHDTLRHGGSTVGLATVYRSLQALAEAGEVDSVVTESGETLYRRCETVDEHHHHLRCRVCGTAKDIEVPQFEEWAQSMAASLGFSQIDHTVEVTGVCERCATQGT
ncbi:transcriptional repressor [Demequina sp. B12]|uniref:Fur family transcriptional regulator n=1 Tax=Demequina sp. B12 TaxID=2992757 RepID=UPI00237C0CDE|nr:Fur family transcriptional regulator [Demequina sp. B12]MDE0572858.1 transcriptional repressor [Demequina sp. B12]